MVTLFLTKIKSNLSKQATRWPQVKIDQIVLSKVKFYLVWSSLIQFDPVWTSLIQFDHISYMLFQFNHIWSSLINYQQNSLPLIPPSLFSLPRQHVDLTAPLTLKMSPWQTPITLLENSNLTHKSCAPVLSLYHIFSSHTKGRAYLVLLKYAFHGRSLCPLPKKRCGRAAGRGPEADGNP